MSNKIAFLFPGQGSQYIGMGKEIYNEFSVANKLMTRANKILGFDLKKLCFEGPMDKLNKTINTQPAIFTISMMINAVLVEKGIRPEMLAGHSLGEYSALAAAHVFSFEEGLKLIRQRAILMDKAFPAGQGAMIAIIGLPKEKVLSICDEVEGICEIANYNSPQQIVISGEKIAIKKAICLAEKRGAKRVVELDVSGPFHSSLMKAAQNKLTKVITKLDLNDPIIPVIANTTADYLITSEKIEEALISQLTNSVRWVEEINLMIKDGIDIFIEVGPGRVLKGLMRRIDRSVKAYNVEDLDSLNNLLCKL